MKKNKFSIGRLFYNDKFVMIFSVLVSIILWFTVSATNTSTESHKVISDIPVTIELSQNAKDNDLMVFNDNQTASVSVSGSSFIVSQVQKENILVTALQAGTIDRAGTYTLVLSAKQQGTLSGYEISQTSLVPQTIQVLVDRLKEQSFEITDNIQYKTDPEYFAGTTKFTPEKITVSGPESIVNEIDKVQADYTISETLTSSQSLTAPIVLYDAEGNQLSTEDYNQLTISNTEVQADIVVLKRATVPVKAVFQNMPSGFNSSDVTVSPSTLEIAGPEATMAEFKSIELSPIDFAEINPDHNKFELKVELPIGCRNLSNASTVTVTVDLSGYSEKTFSVSKNQFSCINVPDGKNPTVLSDQVDVVVVGPSDQLQALTADKISGRVDFENRDTGHKEMEVTFSINDASGCWAYGQYTVSVDVADASS